MNTWPLVVSSEFYKTVPTTPLDLELEHPVAEKYYVLLRFLIDMMFNAEQGTNKGTVIYGASSDYQCTLMIEFLRKSPVGGFCEASNPFPVFFPETMDEHSLLNSCVREMGTKWWKENAGFGEGFEMCMNFLEHVEGTMPDQQNITRYIKERLQKPESFYVYDDDPSLQNHITDEKGRVCIDIGHLSSPKNFAGVRFWFLINDASLYQWEHSLQLAFERNIRSAFRKIFSSNKMRPHLTPRIKSLMTSQSGRDNRSPVFDMEFWSRECQTLIKKYHKVHSYPLYEFDEIHNQIITPMDFVELIDIVLPFQERLKRDPMHKRPGFSFRNIDSLMLSFLHDIGMSATNRNYMKIRRGVSCDYIPWVEYKRLKLEGHLNEYTFDEADEKKCAARHCHTDLTQLDFGNYHITETAGLLFPLMTNNSYMFFHPGHSSETIGRTKLPWRTNSKFIRCCDAIRNIIFDDGRERSPKKSKTQHDGVFLRDEPLFSDVKSTQKCLKDGEKTTLENTGAYEEVAKALQDPLQQYKGLLAQCSCLNSDPMILNKLGNAYSEHALAIWVSTFTTSNPKMCPHNQSLMAWHKKGRQSFDIPSLCPSLSPLSNRYVRFPYDYRHMHNMYNQFNFSSNIINCTYDVLSLPEYDQRVIGAKLKQSIIGFGQHGCGKSFSAEKALETMIDGVLIRRARESAQSAFSIGEGDTSKETKFYDEAPQKISRSGSSFKSEKTSQDVSTLKQCLSDQFMTKETLQKNPSTGKQTKIIFNMNTRMNMIVLLNTFSLSPALEDRFSVMLPSMTRDAFTQKSQLTSRKVPPKELEAFILREQTLQWYTSMTIQMLCSGVIPCGIKFSLADDYIDHFIESVVAVFPQRGAEMRKKALLKRKVWLRTVMDAVIMAFFSECASLFPTRACPFRAIQERIPYFLFVFEESLIQEICDFCYVYVCPTQWQVANMIAEGLCGYTHEHPGIIKTQFDNQEMDREAMDDILDASSKYWCTQPVASLGAEFENIVKTETWPHTMPERRDFFSEKMKNIIQHKSYTHHIYAHYGDDASSYHKCLDENIMYQSWHEIRNGRVVPVRDQSTHRLVKSKNIIWCDENYLCLKGMARSKLIAWVLGHLHAPTHKFHDMETMKRVIGELEKLKMSFVPIPLHADVKWVEKQAKKKDVHPRVILGDLPIAPKDIYETCKEGKVVQNVFMFDGSKTLFINVHFLREGQPKNLLGKWLQSIRTPHTRHRHIPISMEHFNVPGCPELCMMHEMIPLHPGEYAFGCENGFVGYVGEELESMYAKQHHKELNLDQQVCDKIYQCVHEGIPVSKSSVKYPFEYVLDNIVNASLDRDKEKKTTPFVPRRGRGKDPYARFGVFK